MKNKKKRERTKSPIPHHFEFFYFFFSYCGYDWLSGHRQSYSTYKIMYAITYKCNYRSNTYEQKSKDKKNKKETPLNGECEPNPASTSSNPHHHTSTNSPHKPHCQRCHRVRHLGMWRTHPRTLASYQSANSP